MEIVYYPEIKEKIYCLDQKDKSRVIKIIDFFEKYGFQLSREYLKKINKDIWELRAGKYRLLFGVIRQFGIVVDIFYKKTQKTPTKEIKLAVSRIRQYEK